MKKFLTVAVAVLLIIFFTFPTSGFGDIQGTTTDGGGSESTTTTQAPPDSTTTTTSPDSTTTTTSSNTTTTTSPPDSTTTTTVPDNSTTTTIVLGDTTPSQTTTAPDSSTTTTETTLPLDITPPVIILNGNALIELKTGDIFTDPGATATDDKDASVAVTASGTVDTSKAGSYTLTYNASDIEGNEALSVIRTVNVAELPDTTPPVINMIGNTVINLLIGGTFIDPGATAKDDKDLNVQVITTGTVNTNFAGSYIICYDASDVAGNAADTVIRTINVSSTATVNTDKPDYIPSDYVLVTGSGWLSGETVKLDFRESLSDPQLQQTITYYTVADGEGNIRDIQYLIELRHLGASFILKATGLTSGLTAQANFTDLKHLTPSFSPAAGAVASGTRITISSAGSSKIFYTTDGTNPATSITGSTLQYNSSAKPTITANTTIKAIATGYASNSEIGIAAYTIIQPLEIKVYKVIQDKTGVPINDDLQPFEVTLWKVLSDFSSVQADPNSKPFSVLTPAVFNITPDFDGQYFYVKESTPAAYTIISGSDWSVINWANAQRIYSGTNATFTVINKQSGSRFVITKTGLKGFDRAKFTLYDHNNNIIKAGPLQNSITLDCSNELASIYSDTFAWNNLPDDTGYKLVESYDVDVVSNDYRYTSNLINNEFTFDIIAGASVSLPVVNEAIGTIKAYKTDKAGLPLPGAQIGLFANINDANPIVPAAGSSNVTGTPYPPNVEFLTVPSGGILGKTYYIHEISAPDGYTADPGWYPVSISDTNLNPVLSTPIINKANGSITFYKKDKLVDGNPIPDAVFGLYTAKDETLTPITATSGADGKVEFTELTCGKTYFIHETSAPFGFLLDENWYEVNLTTENSPYAFLDPIVNIPGGTITVTKNVIAPDGKTDVVDPKEFTITLQKKDGSGWTPVKSATIKEGSPAVFSVPLGSYYRISETAESKYTQTNKTVEVCLSEQGQNQNVVITNKQHYALIVMGKIIYQPSSPFVITDDDHIFFTKVEGGYAPLIEWHPIATKIPTFFPVWPGTYNVVEKLDVNYNNNGQPVILSGFKLSDFDLADSGDVATLIINIIKNLGNGSEITVEGDDIVPLIIANQYTPDYRNVTVTKDVVAPDGSPASDPKEFNVKLQRLSLTLPNILNMLDLSNAGNVGNLSDLMNMLDLTQLTNLSNLVGWEDVGLPKDVSEGNPVTFKDVEKDHIYRVVETQVPGYMQMCGILPFYLEPDETTDKQIDIVNRQEMIFIKVVKNVIGADGSDVSDNHKFLVKLDGKCLPLYHPFAEGSPTVFAVLPGTYTAMECFEADYNLVDNGGTFTVNFGDGTICNPKIITITNKQKPGSIVITKTVIGGSDKATFNIDGPGNNDFSSIVLASGESWSNTELPWGTYKITETSMNGYQTPSFIVNGKAPVAASSVDVIIGNGDCECLGYRVNVTNTVIPGSLTISKTVVGGSDNATFNVDGPGSNDFGGTIGQGGSLSFTNLPWGTYTITETPMSGYQTPSFVVNGGAPVAASSVIVIVGNKTDEALTYTVNVTNTVIPGSLTIKKTVVGGSDNATFNVDGPGSNDFGGSIGQGKSLSFTNLPWGTYTITETPMSGYQTPSFVVNGGAPVAASSVVVIVGNKTDEALTYTVDVTNTVIPGSLTISKTVIGGSDSALFFVDGPEENDFSFNLAPNVSWSRTDLPWGTYTITEAAMSGYQTPSFVVNGEAPVAASSVVVIIGNGQDAALTHRVDVTNTVIPGSITINKTGMLAGDSIVFTVTGPAGFIPATVTLTAAPGETTASAVLSNLAWGDYTITETINPNYSATPTFDVIAGFNLVQNAGNSVTITIPGTGADNSKILDAILTVTNTYTPPTTPPATAAPSTAQVEVLGLATGEELSQEPARISVLGIKELPLTGENILLIFGGILLIGALSLILALSLRKRPAK